MAASVPWSFARKAALATGGTLVVGVGVSAELFRRNFGDDAIPRLLTAYRAAIPAFAAYRWVQFTKDTGPARLASILAAVHPSLPDRLNVRPDKEAASRGYEALHQTWAAECLRVFLELRGFYIKTGQLIANNIGDASPPHWRRVMEPLLDRVPHKPFAYVKATVEGELGAPLDQLFVSFDEEPIAAASIGQVHRAVLRHPGGGKSPQRVVVKVMYPEVEAQFRGDVGTSKAFVKVALPEQEAALNEIEKQFANEFDYTRESAQLAAVKANLQAASPSFDHIIVPSPLLSLCTKRVLVMEEVPNAEKLGTALERDMAAFAAERGVTPRQFEDEEIALNKAALDRGELRSGPSAVEMEAFISYRRVRNLLTLPLRPFGVKALHTPLNHAKLVDELLRVHGHEIFIDGAFNGDPHPGNVLLSYPDAKDRAAHRARLALIDYGQVKVIDRETRLQLARIIVALDKVRRLEEAAAATTTTKQQPTTTQPNHAAALKEARLKVAAFMKATGFRVANDDPEAIYKYGRLYYDRDDKVSTGGLHVQEYMESLSEKSAIVHVNDEFIMAGRTALMLRGLGHALNQHRSTAQAWAPFARAVLVENGEDPEMI
jgi:aarF domain-containing kinase